MADAGDGRLTRVIPSWTEPAVAAASTLIGGPLGRHAVVGRSRFWTPLRVVLLGAVLVLAAGWLVKAPCIQQVPDGAGGLTLDWTADRQYVSMCYSDIVTLYGGPESAGGPSYRDYPALAALMLRAATWATQRYEVSTAHAHWLPTGLPEAVFFDLLAAVLAVCWLVVVWAVARSRPGRPWDAALVALSPIALVHVFTGLDALAVAGVTAGLYAHSRGRSALGGALLGLAAAVKLYAAVPLLPVLLTPRAGGPDTPGTPDAPNASEPSAGRFVGSAALAWALVNAPASVFATPEWLRFFRQGIHETPGPDSLYNVLGYFTGWPVFEEGHTPWALNWVELGLVVALLVGLVVLARRAVHPPGPAALSFLLVAGLLLVNKSWSPQFSLWLVPLAVLALPRWRLLVTWMTVDALIWVPRMYYYLGVDNKGLPPDPFLVVVLIRDALVVALMVLVVRATLGLGSERGRDGH